MSRQQPINTFVRALRLELIWTMDDLADRVGCNARTVANAEKRSPVSQKTAIGIAEALSKGFVESGTLGVPRTFAIEPGDLFDWSPEETGIAKKLGPAVSPDERRKQIRAFVQSTLTRK